MKRPLMRAARALLLAGALLAGACCTARAATISIACSGVGQELEFCKGAAEIWARKTGNEVKIITPPNDASERLALYQQLLSAGSDRVDVLQIDVIWPGLLGSHLLDLRPYAKGAEQQHFPGFIANNTSHGRLVAMPWFANAGLLFYRSDLLQKYGQQVPETWDALTASARTIQDAERAAGNERMWGYVWQGRAYEGLSCNALEWVVSHDGGSIVEADGRISIDNPRAELALRTAAAWLGRITPTADYAAIGDCDLVIEAVFEDRKVKADTYARAQQYLRKDAIFASNTSTLPINSLAEEFKDPSRFIGIHFFSPVEKMMLVELIVGRNTGDVALATALDYVRQIGKTPIVVNDSRGFYANRCVLRFTAEGLEMLMEGVPPAMIENAARMAGMPVGPLSLSDEVALDLVLRIMKATEADLGPNAIDQQQKKLMVEMVEKEGRYGRKNGKGFYDYPEKGKGQKSLWAGLAALQPRHLDPDTLDVEELKQRFLVAQAVEAARTVEDHVITDPREADVGSILGFGFAPFTGGTLSYIDFMGTKNFVALCHRLEAKYGSRFTPPKLLEEMAANGETFYGRFAPKKAAA